MVERKCLIVIGTFLVYSLSFFHSLDRTRIRGEQFLVRWAIPQLHDIEALTSMVDPSLNGRYPAKSLSYFADIISKCVQVSMQLNDIGIGSIVLHLLLLICQIVS